MTSIVRCTTCRHRSQYYSYEWVDRSGLLDETWRCPSCGGSGTEIVVAPFGDLDRPTRASQRVEAILRALAGIGETTLTVEMLDQDTLLALDSEIRAALDAAARRAVAGVWSRPVGRALAPASS
ncbi:MAG: hypothetical protein RMM58_08955 [Chloroflexota bacterium]|nr:hypothetical protein [Dehalococcoidia bacterium]MDW8253994.1 hypothetical protein [Chloroflexota bacterium]